MDTNVGFVSPLRMVYINMPFDPFSTGENLSPLWAIGKQAKRKERSATGGVKALQCPYPPLGERFPVDTEMPTTLWDDNKG